MEEAIAVIAETVGPAMARQVVNTLDNAGYVIVPREEADQIVIPDPVEDAR